MRSTLLLLVLATTTTLMPEAGAAIRINNKSPRDGVIIPKGRSVRLSCRTDSRWFFCLWRSPGDDKSCAIQQNSSPQSVCDADPRLQLDSGLTNCDVIIRNVQPEDHGRWLCLVNEPEEFDSARETVALEVGQPAEVIFETAVNEKNELRMTEGETAKIRCAALNGHPAAQLSWEEPKDAKLDLKAKPELIHNDKKHTTDVSHTAEYKAELKDNDREITCVATQVDKDGRTVLYESSTSLKLKIDKLVLPVDNALTQKIGIISGVLLAIIFLILLLVFCIFVVCKKRRRRRRSRPPSASDSGSPDEHIKPIWTTGPAANGRGGSLTHPDVTVYTDILDPRSADRRKVANNGVEGLARPMLHANSQGTMSTRSTTSQNSWEEDRSVGGDEEMTAERRLPHQHHPTSPSIHETHFGSDHDLPRTVLHHPDPYTHQPRYAQLLHQQPPPSGSDFASPPYQPYQPGLSPANRPTSAMSYPAAAAEGLLPITRRLPTPNGQLTTSVKSVFDCDLGCFVDLDKNEERPPCIHQTSSSSSESEASARTSDSRPRDV